MKTKFDENTDHRKNGHGTGPKTARGKAISSQNARKHGLLSKELIVSSEDEPVLQELERALNEELAPSSPLLAMLANDIVVCYWDLKMCIRRKNEYLQNLSAESTDPQASSMTLSAAELRKDWTLQRRLELLQQLREAVGHTGSMSDSWKELLISAFGEGFYNDLMEWHATEGIYLLMVETSITKNERYHFRESPPPDQVAAAAKRQAQLEAPVRRAFINKLIDLQERFLVTQASIEASSRSQGSDPLERYQRYETTARRNLHRAIREYLHVRKTISRDNS